MDNREGREETVVLVVVGFFLHTKNLKTWQNCFVKLQLVRLFGKEDNGIVVSEGHIPKDQPASPKHRGSEDLKENSTKIFF